MIVASQHSNNTEYSKHVACNLCFEGQTQHPHPFHFSFHICVIDRGFVSEHISYHSVLVQGLLRDQRTGRLLYSGCFAMSLSPSLHLLHVNHRTRWYILPKRKGRDRWSHCTNMAKDWTFDPWGGQSTKPSGGRLIRGHWTFLSIRGSFLLPARILSKTPTNNLATIVSLQGQTP